MVQGTLEPEPQPEPLVVEEPAPEAAVTNPDERVTEAEVAKMLEYLTRVGAPETVWRMHLMTLGLDELAEMTKGQAHALMAEARARYLAEA